MDANAPRHTWMLPGELPSGDSTPEPCCVPSSPGIDQSLRQQLSEAVEDAVRDALTPLIWRLESLESILCAVPGGGVVHRHAACGSRGCEGCPAQPEAFRRLSPPLMDPIPVAQADSGPGPICEAMEDDESQNASKNDPSDSDAKTRRRKDREFRQQSLFAGASFLRKLQKAAAETLTSRRCEDAHDQRDSSDEGQGDGGQNGTHTQSEATETTRLFVRPKAPSSSQEFDNNLNIPRGEGAVVPVIDEQRNRLRRASQPILSNTISGRTDTLESNPGGIQRILKKLRSLPAGSPKTGPSLKSALSIIPAERNRSCQRLDSAQSETDVRRIEKKSLHTRSELNLVALEMTTSLRSTVFEAAGSDSKRGAPLRFFTWLVGAMLWGRVMPYSLERVTFSFLMAAACFAASLHIPFVISFGISMCDDNGLPRFSVSMYWVQTLMYTLCVLDINLSLRSAYFVPELGLMMTERGKMAKRYAQTWLLPDLVVFIPLVVKLIPSVCSQLHVQLLQVVLLVKVIKVSNDDVLNRGVKAVRRRLGIIRTSFVWSLACGILLVHWSSCAFHYFAYVGAYHGWEGITWMEGLGLEDSHFVDQYFAAVYWAVCTLTTVGYGDVKAENTPERLYCVFSMIVGVAIFAYVLGSMSNLISMLNSRRNEIAVRISSLESFLKRHQIPFDLAKRLQMYTTYVLDRSLAAEDREILSMLSESLRTQTVIHMHSDILNKLSFFKDKPPQLIVYIVEKLKLELQAPGEIIMMEGDTSDEMYFVGEGLLEVWVSKHGVSGQGKSWSAQKFRSFIEERARVSVTDRDFDRWQDNEGQVDHDKVAELQAGEFFGEYSCLMNRKRACSVTAVECSELYILTKKILELALERWPELSVELYELVEGVLGAKDGVSKKGNIVTQLERNADRPTVQAKMWLDSLKAAVKDRRQEALKSDDAGAGSRWARRVRGTIAGRASRTVSGSHSCVTHGTSAGNSGANFGFGVVSGGPQSAGVPGSSTSSPFTSDEPSEDTPEGNQNIDENEQARANQKTVSFMATSTM